MGVRVGGGGGGASVLYRLLNLRIWWDNQMKVSCRLCCLELERGGSAGACGWEVARVKKTLSPVVLATSHSNAERELGDNSIPGKAGDRMASKDVM